MHLGGPALPPPGAEAWHRVLRLRLPALPLALLAHLSQEPVLLRACGAAQPFARLAAAWAAAETGNEKPPRNRLGRLLGGAGAASAARGPAWAVQQLLTGHMLGEAPQQVHALPA